MVLGTGKTLGPFQMLGGGAVHVLSHRHRAHEGHGLDVGVSQQGIHLLLATMDHLQQPRRGTGLLEQLRQAVGGHGVLLGRFEHEGVTGGDGQGEHPQGYHGREVERGNARANAQGLGPGVAVDASCHIAHGFAHHQRGDVGGLLGHFDTSPHIPLGILKGLAGFLAEDLGNLFLVLLEQGLVTQHQPRPLGHRHFLPVSKGSLGGGDGLLHFAGGGRRSFAQHGLGGRVGHRDPLVGMAGNEFAIDQQGQTTGHDSSPRKYCRYGFLCSTAANV